MFRKIGVLALLLLPILGTSNEEKIHVELNEVEFADDGIWFMTPEGVWSYTNTIHVDSSGYFVAQQDQCWICPKCGHRNTRPYPRYRCSRCTWPYDDWRG